MLLDVCFAVEPMEFIVSTSVKVGPPAPDWRRRSSGNELDSAKGGGSCANFASLPLRIAKSIGSHPAFLLRSHFVSFSRASSVALYVISWWYGRYLISVANPDTELGFVPTVPALQQVQVTI